MTARAGLVHSNGVGFLFQPRMYAAMCSRSARLEGKFVALRDYLPRMPKNPSTWFSQEALVGV